MHSKMCGQNLQELDSLEACYAHIEQNAINYRYLHQIADLFSKVRDKMHVEKKTEEEQKAQWEMDLFNFSISNNTIGPMFEGTNAKGEKVSYPSFDTFVDLTYEYIKKDLRRLLIRCLGQGIPMCFGLVPKNMEFMLSKLLMRILN
jgi:hypothetical protein